MGSSHQRRTFLAALGAGLVSPAVGWAQEQRGEGTCTGDFSFGGGSIRLELSDADYHARPDGPFAGQVSERDILSAAFELPFPATALAAFDQQAPSNYQTTYPNRVAKIRFQLERADPSWEVGPITYDGLSLLLPNYLRMVTENSARSFLENVSLVVGQRTIRFSLTGMRDYVARSHWTDTFVPIPDAMEPEPTPEQDRQHDYARFRLKHEAYVSLIRDWRNAQANGRPAVVRATTTLNGQSIDFPLPAAFDERDLRARVSAWQTSTRTQRAAGRCQR